MAVSFRFGIVACCALAASGHAGTALPAGFDRIAVQFPTTSGGRIVGYRIGSDQSAVIPASPAQPQSKRAVMAALGALVAISWVSPPAKHTARLLPLAYTVAPMPADYSRPVRYPRGAKPTDLLVRATDQVQANQHDKSLPIRV